MCPVTGHVGLCTAPASTRAMGYNAGGGCNVAKKKKVRVDMRKNRSKPPRERQWTRGFQEHGFAEEATTSGERVRAKGELSRRRTIIKDDSATEMPAVDMATCLHGRVLRVHGLVCVVEADNGRSFRCAVRR